MAKQSIFRGFRVPKLHFLILLTLPLLFHAETIRQEVARAGILDGHVLPKSYDIHIMPDYEAWFDAMTHYEGTVVIVLTLEAPKSELLLNAAEGMEVNEVEVTKVYGDVEGEDPIDIETEFDHDEENERITIKPSTNFLGGRYNMTIKYKGLLTPTGSVGFYKSAYTTTSQEKEETRYLLTTKFEPTHARKAFPCFDEPSFKATFKISVDVPEGYWALSNTVVDHSVPADKAGQTTIHFKETPVMSTYLVAFIIYEKVSFHRSFTIILKSEVDITAWGPQEDTDEEHLLDFSQVVSKAAVEALESFTDIKYNHGAGMTKIDQVAVKDFSSGAMENWGLITYREAYIYYSEDRSEAQKKSVATTLAHELAHQWFGNLVTMNWWSNTWLNEGFAQFFQFYSLNSAYPEWRMMEQILVDLQQGIFPSDADESSEALTHDVTTFEEIRGQFGSITYYKGASVLRMIYYIMGEENFREALRSYLRSRLFANAQPSDLWSALEANLPSDFTLPEVGEEEQRSPLAVVLETWTLQPGFPVLRVERDYESNTVTFSQKRFFLQGETEAENKYWIPVTCSVNGDSNEMKMYVYEGITVEGPNETVDWLLVHARGYYRVNYDQENWNALALELNGEGKDSIEAMDRAQLVDDAFSLARAGYTPFSHVVPLLRYLSLEDDPLPWVAAIRAFPFLDRVLAPTDTEDHFYLFIRESIGLLYKEIRLGNGATHIHRVHQANIILWACRSGHAECLTDVTNLANEYLNEEATIKSHLRKNVLCYAIREKTDFWQKAYDRLDKDDRSDILSALTCTKDEARQKQLLNLDLSDSEFDTLLSDLSSNPEGLSVSLDFFIEKFDDILTSHPSSVNTALLSFGNRITTKDNQQKLTSLMTEKGIDEDTRNKAESAMQENLNWLEKYGEEALEAFTPPDTTTDTPDSTTDTSDSTTDTADSTTDISITSTDPPPPGPGGQAAIEPLPMTLVLVLLSLFLHNA